VAGRARFKRKAQEIVVFIECLRSDHVHCYGYERETTPFLDSVVAGKQGLMWSDFKANASGTMGTFSRVANYVITAKANQVPTAFYSGNANPAGRKMCEAAVDFRSWPAWYDRKGDRPASLVLIEEFIQRYRGRDNFFAVLHLQETHAKYQPWGNHRRFVGDALWERHKKRWGHMAMPGMKIIDKVAGLVDWEGEDSLLWTEKGSRFKGKRVGKHPACYIAAYDGAIRFLDSLLPDLFSAFPDAEIFVTGDHGEGMGERGFCIHAYGMQPELIRVPLIARTPEPIVQTTRVVYEPGDHMMMLNTILSRWGIKPAGKKIPFPSSDPEVLRRLEGLGYVGR
jgi:hypothetical protein